VYWEFPHSLDSLTGTLHTADAPLKMGQTLWERAVAVRPIGKSTPNMSLLHPHKQVDYVVLSGVTLSPIIVLAKVAGYDSATDGLPTAPDRVFPLLATPSQSPLMLLAATPLSNARTRRFSPSARWQEVVAYVLNHIAPKADVPISGLWVPSVTASFPPDGPLPDGAEATAVERGVGFFSSAGLLLNADSAAALARVCSNSSTADECANFARRAPPFNFAPGGGQLGVFEGCVVLVSTYFLVVSGESGLLLPLVALVWPETARVAIALRMKCRAAISNIQPFFFIIFGTNEQTTKGAQCTRDR
jgi:hypothetical protein